MARLASTPWWKDPKKDGPAPHARLIPLVQSMQRTQQGRYDNMRKMQAVYEYGYTAAPGETGETAIEDRRLHQNIAKNAIDTMAAGLCASRITCMVLTEGGTWTQRNRAKMATKAVDGVCDENDVEELTEDIVLDGATAYCGFFKVFHEVIGEGEDRYAELRVERAIPLDVYVDRAEGRHRKPRCMYHRYYVDRHVAMELWGGSDPDLYGAAADRKAAIKKAPGGKSPEAPDAGDEAGGTADMIEVWEAWHLPSGGATFKDGKPTHDGRRCIAIDGCTVLFEPWNRERFPLAVYRPEKARLGFWGLAAMRQAMAAQREHEKVTEKIQRAHKMMGVSAFVVGSGGGAEFDMRQIANGQGMVWHAPVSVDQVKPFTPEPVAVGTVQYRESIAQDLLRFFGMSTFQAQNEVPAGLQNGSGKALQKFVDEGDKRQIIKHRALERAKVDLFDLIIDEARDCIKRGIPVKTRYHDKHGFEPIDWKDIVEVIDDRKGYVVRTFPVGMLAQTPAAKFAQLDVLLERQIITVEQFKRLFGMPDLEAESDVECSDYEIVDKIIDKMVTSGKYLGPPEPFDDKQLILSRGRKILNAYRVADVPDDRLALVRRYLSDTQAAIDKDAAAANQNAAPPPAGAEPMPPPMDPMAGGPAPMDPMGAPPPQLPPGLAPAA
ncbi:MAG TPA: hypothetical protein VEC14_03290 [Reyranellaceae bacterium]|nr:hypothetical protein [Reyranellaceae bacterium]